MRYQQEQAYENQDGNSLVYKDHSEFFSKFHNIRTKFTVEISESYFNTNMLKDAIKTVIGLIEWTSIYIEKSQKLEIIDEKIQNVNKYLESGKLSKIREELKSVFRILTAIYEYNELIPQVKEVKKENEDIDMLTKHALAAYKIINCVK
jgi:hypothetical protein